MKRKYIVYVAIAYLLLNFFNVAFAGDAEPLCYFVVKRQAINLSTLCQINKTRKLRRSRRYREFDKPYPKGMPVKKYERYSR